jgi:hypothetical protein
MDNIWLFSLENIQIVAYELRSHHNQQFLVFSPTFSSRIKDINNLRNTIRALDSYNLNTWRYS